MILPCIIVGCTHKEHTLEGTPPNYNDPPESIICINCGNRTNSVYRRQDFYFSVFFIRCCRIKKGMPYLSCGTCHESFGNYGLSVCRQCTTGYPNQFRHCPNCGKYAGA